MLYTVRHIWLFLCFLVFIVEVSAQNISKIESLQKLLHVKTGVEKYDLLNEIGFEYRLSYPDSTIYYCTQAYELGQSLDLKKDLSRPLSFIGLANDYKGNHKTSFDFHSRAIEVALKQNDSTQLAYSHNNFGRLLFDQGDMTRAYNNMIQSLVLFEKLNDSTGLAYVYRSLTIVHKSQRDYPKALEMALKAYNLRAHLGDSRALLSALMELGSVYSGMNDPEKAKQSFEKADSIANHIKDEISLAEIRIGWAEFLISNKDTTEAHALAHQTYAMVTDAGNLRLLPRVQLLMGNVHYLLNELTEAKLYLEKVTESSDEGQREIQRDAYLYLTKIYEQEGRKADAIVAMNKYLILKESLQSVEMARQIEKLQFQLEIGRIESENELLKSKEANNDSIIQKQQLQNVFLIVVLLFIILLVFVQRYNAKKRNESIVSLAQQNLKIDTQRQEIEDKNRKLEKRNNELYEINHEKDTLMNIVAHDLKSPLNRIKGLTELILMEGNLNGYTNEKKYIGLLKDATQSGLDLIADLLDVNALDVNREPNYSFFDLSTFIESRIAAFQHIAASKSISLKSECTFKDLVFLDKSYLTRIVDNLISNAIKFSKDNSVVFVQVEARNGFCSIQVRDEGPGFGDDDLKHLYQKFKKLSARPTAGESSNGLGLAIVKILVERMGGRIELQTQQNKGSTFDILFPLNDIVKT